MSDKKITVLDVLARIENLERENDSLKKDLDKLKAQQAQENWQELILYHPENSNTPVEITWAEQDDEKKQKYYREEEPMRREVIGLIRKVQS